MELIFSFGLLGMALATYAALQWWQIQLFIIFAYFVYIWIKKGSRQAFLETKAVIILGILGASFGYGLGYFIYKIDAIANWWPATFIPTVTYLFFFVFIANCRLFSKFKLNSFKPREFFIATLIFLIFFLITLLMFIFTF